MNTQNRKRLVIQSGLVFLCLIGLIIWRPSLLVGKGFLFNFGDDRNVSNLLVELEPRNFLQPSSNFTDSFLNPLYLQNLAAVISSLPSPTTNSLANTSTLRGNSKNFDPGNPVTGLFDNCVNSTPICNPGSGVSYSFWAEFDLGQLYKLTSTRLFGDADNSWVSKTWSLLYKSNVADTWTTAFTGENALFNGWSTKTLSATARYVRVEVFGPGITPTVQAREFQLFGSPAPPPTSTTTALYLFNDSFSADARLEEAGSIGESKSLFWWVNSGGWFISLGGKGKTVQGDLPATDPWRLKYAVANPSDTDNGYHPQNIFRFVQRGSWSNFIQEAYFKINKVNVSASSNRNASNGILLFDRYQAGDNLYYAGVRVDGVAVIKKKKAGVYYTMASNKIFTNGSYDRVLNPNLLPVNVWIGLRSTVTTDKTTGAVNIKLYTDVNKVGVWVKVLDVTDNNQSFGGAAISGDGYAGIRTDFMDVEFDDYKITAI